MILYHLKHCSTDMEGNLTYTYVSILDPRFKAASFLNKSTFQTAKAKIIDEMVVLSQTASISADGPPFEVSVFHSDTRDKASKGLSSYYKDYFSKRVHQVNDSDCFCERETL